MVALIASVAAFGLTHIWPRVAIILVGMAWIFLFILPVPSAHQLHAHQPKRGYSNARNMALQCEIRQAQADLFVFLHDDVIPDAELVKHQIATMEIFDADVTAGSVMDRKP